MNSNAIVDGQSIPTQVEEFIGRNILEIEAGTNGCRVEDSGICCRTYFRIKDIDNTDIRLDFEPLESGNRIGEVTIMLRGDSELDTFLDGLRFAVDTLERQIDKRKPEVRFTNEEVGVLLNLLQQSLDSKTYFGKLSRSIKEKLERRFEQ